MLVTIRHVDLHLTSWEGVVGGVEEADANEVPQHMEELARASQDLERSKVSQIDGWMGYHVLPSAHKLDGWEWFLSE